jgi:hypothetical protein
VEFCLDPPRERPPPARWTLVRATYGQYPDILADARDVGGLREVAARIPRHVARVLRHRA